MLKNTFEGIMGAVNCLMIYMMASIVVSALCLPTHVLKGWHVFFVPPLMAFGPDNYLLNYFFQNPQHLGVITAVMILNCGLINAIVCEVRARRQPSKI